MKPSRLLAAGLVGLCTAAPAALPSPCEADPRGPSIAGRMENMRAYMDRIERSADPIERRRLMSIHPKAMGEGVRELRKRDAGMPCREEMMHAMMEQMLRHQLAEREARER